MLWILPGLVPVLAAAVIVLRVGCMSSVKFVWIYDMASGFMVVIVSTLSLGGKGEMRRTSIIVLIILVLVWESRD